MIMLAGATLVRKHIETVRARARTETMDTCTRPRACEQRARDFQRAWNTKDRERVKLLLLRTLCVALERLSSTNGVDSHHSFLRFVNEVSGSGSGLKIL